MPDLYETIKKIAVDAVAAGGPVELCFGTVHSVSPFKIRVSQKLVLPKDYFIVRQGVSAASFKVGDVIILLRMQGGQKYLIFDKKGGL